jgi:radical SAM protein with 4Fe4S-binding SPASM domain
MPLRYIFWETTAGCNLECIHCRRTEVSRTLMKSDLTIYESLKLIDQIELLQNESDQKIVLVLSGGEPLMRKDIFEIAGYSTGKKIMTCLSSNGVLINDEIAGQISNAKIARVSISLDGARPATHDSFRRQSGSFNAALEGLRCLKKTGVSVQINCTFTKHNIHERDEMYKLALNEGVDCLYCLLLVPVGCGQQIPLNQRLQPHECEMLLNWVYDMARERRIFVRITCAPQYIRVFYQRQKNDDVQLNFTSGRLSIMTKGCMAGNEIIFISNNGTVFPCGYLPLPCGNIRKQTLKSIYNGSETLNMMRNPEQLLGKCGACEYKNICLGCRARAYFKTGNYMDEEPLCDYIPLKSQQP